MAPNHNDTTWSEGEETAVEVSSSPGGARLGGDRSHAGAGQLRAAHIGQGEAFAAHHLVQLAQEYQLGLRRRPHRRPSPLLLRRAHHSPHLANRPLVYRLLLLHRPVRRSSLRWGRPFADTSARAGASPPATTDCGLTGHTMLLSLCVRALSCPAPSSSIAVAPILPHARRHRRCRGIDQVVGSRSPRASPLH